MSNHMLGIRISKTEERPKAQNVSGKRQGQGAEGPGGPEAGGGLSLRASVGRRPWVRLDLKLLASRTVLLCRSVLPDSLRPQDCSTPGFPVLRRFLELAQTHPPGNNCQMVKHHEGYP